MIVFDFTGKWNWKFVRIRLNNTQQENIDAMYSRYSDYYNAGGGRLKHVYCTFWFKCQYLRSPDKWLLYFIIFHYWLCCCVWWQVLNLALRCSNNLDEPNHNKRRPKQVEQPRIHGLPKTYKIEILWCPIVSVFTKFDYSLSA